MTWLYQGKPFLSSDIGDYHGFVYIITDSVSGRFYIGKKSFATIRRLPPLKGQRRKRTVEKESDWQSYFGSNEALSALVEEHGPDRFRREIVHLCRSKGEASFVEAQEQFAHDVLRRDDCFNQWICVKVHRKHLRQT